MPLPTGLVLASTIALGLSDRTRGTPGSAIAARPGTGLPGGEGENGARDRSRAEARTGSRWPCPSPCAALLLSSSMATPRKPGPVAAAARTAGSGSPIPHRVQSLDVSNRDHHVLMLADYGHSQEDPEYEG